MKMLISFVLIAALAGFAFWIWTWYRQYAERRRLSEERFANVMVQAMGTQATAPADALALAQQKLLYEAAAKAGEAGEAVLAIQLYARLIARYPQSAFGTQASAAVEVQKKKLAKP